MDAELKRRWSFSSLEWKARSFIRVSGTRMRSSPRPLPLSTRHSLHGNVQNRRPQGWRAIVHGRLGGIAWSLLLEQSSRRFATGHRSVFPLVLFRTIGGRDPTTPEHTQINAFALNLWISVFWNVVAALALLRRLPRLGVHSREGRRFVALVYSFATLVLPFGCSAWGHSTAAAFITLGTLDVAVGSRARCVLGGLWLGWRR